MFVKLAFGMDSLNHKYGKRCWQDC